MSHIAEYGRIRETKTYCVRQDDRSVSDKNRNGNAFYPFLTVYKIMKYINCSVGTHGIIKTSVRTADKFRQFPQYFDFSDNTVFLNAKEGQRRALTLFSYDKGENYEHSDV